MKTFNQNLLLLSTLMAGLGLMPTGRLIAQTFTTLHSFAVGNTNSFAIYTNNDGIYPFGHLTLSGTNLYGTMGGGGISGNGTVFKINTDGTGFTNLYSFTASVGSGGIFQGGTNSDGAGSSAGLFLSGTNLYGTGGAGGSFGNGTVFRINTDGTGFTNLYNFPVTVGNAGVYGQGTNRDGALPNNVILSGTILYGTTYAGGKSGNGTVFKINSDGTGFTNLHSFASGEFVKGYYTNSDGVTPNIDCLILSGNTLYGTAPGGGSSGNGTVFRIKTDGTGFTNLHSFTATTGQYSTNYDGTYPQDRLTLWGNTLYGAAFLGGAHGDGTVFALSTNGIGFTTLHNFTSGSDGALPNNVIISGNALFGTTAEPSGISGVYKVNTDSTGFTNLYSFTALVGGAQGVGTNSDGYYPRTGLVLSGDTLYGTTWYGGSGGNGTIFSLSFEPQLAITQSGTNVILTWPTNVAGFDYSGFTLESNTNLAATNWSTVSGQFSVTNPASGKHKFYRLRW